MSRYTLPFFLAGMGSALEVWPAPCLFPVRRYPDGLTDAQRLASDWYRVGHSLYSAIGSLNAEKTGGEEESTGETR
jgi:hypothetical protein